VNYNEDNFRQWLISEISRNQAYHNHKETMAWTATAFYVTGIITLGYFSNEVSFSHICLMVVLILLALCTFFFLLFQFNNRWVAAGRIEGLIRTISNLQIGSDFTSAEQEIGQLYPKFVEKEIPKYSRFGNSRWEVELPSYIAILISTIIAILLLLQ
jgi:Ca2+/Na+ antiporter